MIDWTQVLVIMLSIVLIIFLIAGITLVVMVIGITQQIKRVASTAERTVEHIEGAMKGVARGAGPMMLAKMIIDRMKGKR